MVLLSNIEVNSLKNCFRVIFRNIHFAVNTKTNNSSFKKMFNCKCAHDYQWRQTLLYLNLHAVFVLGH